MQRLYASEVVRIDNFSVVHSDGSRTIDGISPLLMSLGAQVAGFDAPVASGDTATLKKLLLDRAPRGISDVCLVVPAGSVLERAVAAVSGRTIRFDHASDVEQILEEGVAAVVVEPSMQASGMIAAPPGRVRTLRKLCDQRGILLIADETVTGMGRSGFLWGVTRDGVTPDMLCVGPMLTGGDGTVGAILHTSAVTGLPSDSVSDADAGKAIATLEMLERDNFLGEARRKATNLAEALTGLEALPQVAGVRSRGLLAGIELRGADGPAVVDRARGLGASIGAFDGTLALAPPLAIPDDLLERLIAAVADAIKPFP